MLPKLMEEVRAAPPKTTDSVSELVRYLRDEERRHYCETYDMPHVDSPEWCPVHQTHIYYHVERVTVWLNEAPVEYRFTWVGVGLLLVVVALFVYGPELFGFITGVALSQP